MQVECYIERLRKNGRRVTPKVEAVLRLFLKRQSILDPFEVQALLKKEYKGVGLPTVYRILDNLTRNGILFPVASPDRQLRYFICQKIDHEHHHHFICRKCGRVEEVNVCVIHEVSRYVKLQLNGTVESHFLQIEGLCAKCG
jgi:Fur family transcriptional regulator, ferric uptake regulator